MNSLGRRLAAAATATAVFAITLLVALAVTPYAFRLLYGRIPPEGSCGDSVGIAMLLSMPVSVPLIVIVAGALAVLAYSRIMRVRSS